jgi:hypothetical protein
MKAHDILAEVIGLLSGALAHVDTVDSTLRAVADTSSDIGDGFAPESGIEPEAAVTLAHVLRVERDTLLALRCNLSIVRMHVRSLAPALKTGVQLDRLGIPRGGEA